MGLNIKNEETHRLARELSQLTGESMTDAVTEAVPGLPYDVAGAAISARRDLVGSTVRRCSICTSGRPRAVPLKATDPPYH